jgi:hypothetical protein
VTDQELISDATQLPAPYQVERPSPVPRWRIRNKLHPGNISSDDDLHITAQIHRLGRRVLLKQGANVITISADTGAIDFLCQVLRAADTWKDAT